MSEDLDNTAEAFFEKYLEAHLAWFAQLQSDNPDLAKAIEPDFDQFVAVSEALYEQIGGSSSFKAVQDLIPDNKWVKMIPLVLNGVTQHSENDLDLSARRREIGRKLKGTSKN